MQNSCVERCEVVFLCCFVFDMGWRQQDKLRGQNPCTERCDVGLLSSSLVGLATARQTFGTFCTAVLMSLIQGWRCRPVARFVDLLTDGMVVFCFSLNSGRTAQYKHNTQFLRLFGLHGDVNDAHRAGANRLQSKQQNTESAQHSRASAAPHLTDTWTREHITLHYITLHYITLHYITLHYITLHYITLHYITLHYITLHYITLHYITLHYITLHYITLHYITLHYITLHYITLHYITLHYITLHYITLHYITLQYITLHYITSHHITSHYITLHYIYVHVCFCT